jgi:hypothetical protein
MQIYNIPAHRRGDTWEGIGSITINYNNNPIDLTNAIIKMEVREGIDSPAVITFTSEDNTILKNDAANGIFSIPGTIIDIPFGKYIYDIQIATLEKTKTYIGGTWEIVSDVTE